VKKFVLLRGKDSGSLYLYDRETYDYFQKHENLNHGFVLEFVLDHDDREVLEGYQKLVNHDIHEELTNVRTGNHD
jgi:hypothetical protein